MKAGERAELRSLWPDQMRDRRDWCGPVRECHGFWRRPSSRPDGPACVTRRRA